MGNFTTLLLSAPLCFALMGPNLLREMDIARRCSPISTRVEVKFVGEFVGTTELVLHHAAHR